MELKGKKIYFLGDSITEGVGASDAEHCYVSVFGKLSGAIVKIMASAQPESPARPKT